MDRDISNELEESDEVDDTPINVDDTDPQICQNSMSVDQDAARGEFIRDALAIQMWRLLCNEFREIKILL